MFEPVKIAPSVLSADFMHMEDSIRLIERGGAGYVHVDVMDGHFVPNITLGIPFVKQLKSISSLPLDVHLMVSNPSIQTPWFLEAGADIITFHYEVFEDAIEEGNALIEVIHASHAKAAIALKPSTPTAVLKPFIEKLDMVLIMSVNPGFSGQSYIAGSENRVAEVVRMAKEAQVSPLIQVDGGIDLITAGKVAAAGADVLVAGNAVYKAPDIKKAIEGITQVAMSAQPR